MAECRLKLRPGLSVLIGALTLADPERNSNRTHHGPKKCILQREIKRRTTPTTINPTSALTTCCDAEGEVVDIHRVQGRRSRSHRCFRPDGLAQDPGQAHGPENRRPSQPSPQPHRADTSHLSHSPTFVPSAADPRRSPDSRSTDRLSGDDRSRHRSMTALTDRSRWREHLPRLRRTRSEAQPGRQRCGATRHRGGIWPVHHPRRLIVD